MGRQVGEPDLDERADRVLETGLPGDLERLFPALARLRRIDPLLQAVVARDEQLLNAFTGVGIALHKPSLTRQHLSGSWGPAMARIRVLIADDHRLFAEALEAILGGDERIDVVGQAGDGREAVRLASELHPDVVLMDI